MGTGGAIVYALHQFNLKGSFLVANSDTWLGSGIQQVCDAESPAMTVVQVENTERYGRVRVETGKVIEFEEKKRLI